MGDHRFHLLQPTVTVKNSASRRNHRPVIRDDDRVLLIALVHALKILNWKNTNGTAFSFTVACMLASGIKLISMLRERDRDRDG